MRCNKCGKETSVLCLCGKCIKCNGIKEISKEDFEVFLKKLGERNNG